MKSLTKNKLSKEQISELVMKHFKETTELNITELANGRFNSVYLIQGNNLSNDGIVLKVGPRLDAPILTYEKNIMRTEVKVYELLADKVVPTPKVLAYDFSRGSCEFDYFFMERLDGVGWNKVRKALSDSESSKLKTKLGHCLATIHSVEGNWFGYIKDDRSFQFNSWSEAYTSMLTNVLNDAKRLNCKIPYSTINNIILKYRDILDEIKTPKLVNFDMWAGNVFVKKEKEDDISGIIDFERSFYGDPYADFVTSKLLIVNVENEYDFQVGYNEITGKPLVVSEHDKIRMNLYRLYLAVIMSAEANRYNRVYTFFLKRFLKGEFRDIFRNL